MQNADQSPADISGFDRGILENQDVRWLAKVAFARDGVVLLRGIFAADVDELRDGVAANMADPAPNARHYRSGEGDGTFFTDYCNWQRIAQYERFLRQGPAAAVAGILMDAREVRLFHEHVLVKEPGAATATPWHQDLPYYSVRAARTCSIWIALDPVDAQVCPQFVAGSHLWGASYRPERFNREPLNPGDAMAPAPDVDADREAYDIRFWALQPGDAIAFDYRLLHGAPANRSTRRRRGFSARFVGEGATFRREEGLVTSPPFPDVTLADGDPLDGPEFPVVWRAD